MFYEWSSTKTVQAIMILLKNGAARRHQEMFKVTKLYISILIKVLFTLPIKFPQIFAVKYLLLIYYNSGDWFRAILALLLYLDFVKPKLFIWPNYSKNKDRLALAVTFTKVLEQVSYLWPYSFPSYRRFLMPLQQTAFWKHCDKRRNCTKHAISPFAFCHRLS